MRKAVPPRTKVFRCAIYTRKSSEEGLEQDFNYLHAQRESCDAYIKSQRHEGWVPLPALYDDGGFSGGSTERPALKRLLADIQSHLIDVVVVYKVDRLTRSLADFAKIVEIFDAAGVSFVSVTQQFNTTTSMGRLTLNVLLSFAQFEREVTGERILDKILSNPLYIGEIEHRGVRYRGQHPPLVAAATWDAVQAQLAANHHENRARTNAKSKSLLAGLIYDDAGNRLVSSHATKNGKRYRYYVTSEGTGRSVAAATVPRLWLPAATIDELVRTKLQSFLTDKAQISTLLPETRCRPAEIGSGLAIASKFADSLTSPAPMAQNVADLLARVTVSPTSLNISIKRDRLLAVLTDTFVEPSQDKGQDNILSLEAGFSPPPRPGARQIV